MTRQTQNVIVTSTDSNLTFSIRIYCDIESGTTEVGEETHAKIETCQDNGCYKFLVEYGTPKLKNCPNYKLVFEFFQAKIL